MRISKVHAAYSFGASKLQILRHVILPNALPEIFTGVRISMGVCWGTIAKHFRQTDTVVINIMFIGFIGFIGYGIEMFTRYMPRKLIPWKGKG